MSLQQHITDSLEKFDDQFCGISGKEFGSKWMYREDLSNGIKNFLKQSLLEQLDIIKGEIDILASYDPETYHDNDMDCIISMEERNVGDYLKRQDVLDLLTIKQ